MKVTVSVKEFSRPKRYDWTFPQFDDEDSETWTCQAEQFFEIYSTPTEHCISLPSFHMDGKALVWFKEFHASNLSLYGQNLFVRCRPDLARVPTTTLWRPCPN
jgi:hypothetical protein